MQFLPKKSRVFGLLCKLLIVCASPEVKSLSVSRNGNSFWLGKEKTKLIWKRVRNVILEHIKFSLHCTTYYASL